MADLPPGVPVQAAGNTPPGPDSPGSGVAVSFKFPKSRRVLERQDFQRIQGRGVRLPSGPFLIMALRQPGKPVPMRLGLTTSKKSGESVARSRIRRLVREAFRLNPHLFPAGWDIVVIAREGADATPLAAVVEALARAMEKLKAGQGKPNQPHHKSGGGRPGGKPHGARPGDQARSGQGRPSGNPSKPNNAAGQGATSQNTASRPHGNAQPGNAAAPGGKPGATPAVDNRGPQSHATQPRPPQPQPRSQGPQQAAAGQGRPGKDAAPQPTPARPAAPAPSQTSPAGPSKPS